MLESFMIIEVQGLEAVEGIGDLADPRAGVVDGGGNDQSRDRLAELRKRRCVTGEPNFLSKRRTEVGAGGGHR